MEAWLHKCSSWSCSCWGLSKASRRLFPSSSPRSRCRSRLWCRRRKRSARLMSFVILKVPQRLFDSRAGRRPYPMQTDQIKQPDVIKPVSVLVYPSCQDCYSFFVYDVERVVLPWTGPLLVCSQQFPTLEFYIEVLSCLAEDVDEEEVVVEGTSLVLASKAEDSVVLDLVAVVGVEVVGVDDLVPANTLVGLGLVADGEDKGVEEVAAGEGDKDEVLAESLLLVQPPADHQRAPEEGGGVVLQAESSSRPLPLAPLEVKNQQLGVEAFPLLALEAHPSDHNKVALEDLDGVEAGRGLGCLPLPTHLHPLALLVVVAVEKGEPLEAALVVTAEEIDLPVGAEEGGTVADGGEEGVEAAVGEGEHLEGGLHEGGLLPLDDRRLHHLLPLLLDLLQLRHLPLKQTLPPRPHLPPQILAER